MPCTHHVTAPSTLNGLLRSLQLCSQRLALPSSRLPFSHSLEMRLRCHLGSRLCPLERGLGCCHLVLSSLNALPPGGSEVGNLALKILQARCNISSVFDPIYTALMTAACRSAQQLGNSIRSAGAATHRDSSAATS